MRTMKRVQQALLVSMLMLVPAISVGAPDKAYRADLSGKNEIPRVKTPARGDLRLTVSGGELTYQLSVEKITSPSAANIHRGSKGENGPPVAGLFGGPAKIGSFGGILSQGKITEESLLGELQGKTVADLVRLIESGNAYVNVLTETYPAGEIRGQLRRK